MRPDRVLYALAATLVCAGVIAATVLVGDRPVVSTAHQISFPHGTRCDQPDAYTGPPCRAARDLLRGAQTSNPELYCRARFPRSAYEACVAQIFAADSGGFDSFYASDFHVLYARLKLDGVARIRVRVLTTDGTTTDLFLWFQRFDGWYRVTQVACASCGRTPPPAG